MSAIWERYRRREIGLNDVVDLLAASGKVQEVTALLEKEEERGSALYVLSELPTAIMRPAWKLILPYVRDPDEQNAFYALGIVHDFVCEMTPHDLLNLLRSANLESPVIFAKLFALMLSLTNEMVESIYGLARSGSFPANHRAGLAQLSRPNSVAMAEIREILQCADPISRFYGCCLVGRHRPHNQSLTRLLPKRVQRRLEFHLDYLRLQKGSATPEGTESKA